MKKFTCGHCGGRLAVNPRHLERLVHCPECGKPTHPLAAEILSAAKTGDPAPRALSAEPVDRKCENCGKSIGRLEKLQLWENHLVCGACHVRLVPPPRPTRRGKTPQLPAPAKDAERPAAVAGDVIEPAARALPAPPAAAAAAKAAPIIPVAVSRVAAATYAAVPPHVRQRSVVVLAAVLIAGLALYGLLSLLRDLMGILIAIALILVCSAFGLGVARVGFVYLKKWIPALRARRAAAAGAKAAAAAAAASTATVIARRESPTK